MKALIAALDDSLQAAIALDLGEKEHARGWLDRGATPAAAAFPPGSREAFGLALVYGALLEEAA